LHPAAVGLNQVQGIDGGEEELFHLAMHLHDEGACFRYLTGDWRCLKALAQERKARPVYQVVKSNVIHMEQVLEAIVGGDPNFPSVLNQIRRKIGIDAEIDALVDRPDSYVISEFGSRIARQRHLTADILATYI
jgi:hypothetical protein